MVFASVISLIAPPEPRVETRRRLVPPRPWYRRRWAVWSSTVVLLVIAVFYVGGGWYFSGEIRSGAFDIEAPGAPKYDVRVLALTANSITLDRTTSDNDHLTAPGIKGIAWSDGYGRVADIIEITGTSVTRDYTPVIGALAVGTMVDIDGFAYPGDPETALGLDFETVAYLSPTGYIDAWHVPASGDAWVIFVHGKSAPLREALRLIPAVHDAGWDALVIEYRNDPGTIPDARGMYRYGLTEWRDVAAAVDYVQQVAPAADIALVGYSMGGAIVAGYLLEAENASAVDAVVLDAPMLDLSSVISHQAADRELPLVGIGVPGSLTWVARVFAGWRYDVPWGALDYLDRLIEADYATPTVVFHGTGDTKVPIATSRALAERASSVELIEVPMAGHVQSWNVDPDGYDAAVAALLGRIGT